MNYDKYEFKAREIHRYCRNKRIKYKLIGASILIISAIILLTLLLNLKKYSLYILMALIIVPSIEAEIIISRLKSIRRYEQNQLDLIEKLILTEELKDEENYKICI